MKIGVDFAEIWAENMDIVVESGLKWSTMDTIRAGHGGHVGNRIRAAGMYRMGRRGK
jgi:hypothetical protein